MIPQKVFLLDPVMVLKRRVQGVQGEDLREMLIELKEDVTIVQKLERRNDCCEKKRKRTI